MMATLASLLLVGCGSSEKQNSAAAPMAMPTQPDSAETGNASASVSVERLVADYVALMSVDLPATLGPQTLIAVRAEGKDVVLSFVLPRDAPPRFSREELTRIANREDRVPACSSDKLSRIIALGGRVRAEYETPNGTRFQSLVTSCP